MVSLGDSFHDGEGAARLHASSATQLAALMAGRDWIWVAGNHDPGRAGRACPATTVARARRRRRCVFRHEPSRGAAPGEIAGHLHPCARIVQRGRSVRRRCFAGDGQRLVMPAFGAYAGWLNVLDRAYAGLFRRDGLMAYMIGATASSRSAGAHAAARLKVRLGSQAKSCDGGISAATTSERELDARAPEPGRQRRASASANPRRLRGEGDGEEHENERRRNDDRHPAEQRRNDAEHDQQASPWLREVLCPQRMPPRNDRVRAA